MTGTLTARPVPELVAVQRAARAALADLAGGLARRDVETIAAGLRVVVLPQDGETRAERRHALHCLVHVLPQQVDAGVCQNPPLVDVVAALLFHRPPAGRARCWARIVEAAVMRDPDAVVRTVDAALAGGAR